MIYLKSFLAGLIALVVGVMILAGIAFGAMEIMMRRLSSEGGMGSFAVNGPWISIPLLLIALVAASIFLAGSYWQFRRTRRYQ